MEKWMLTKEQIRRNDYKAIGEIVLVLLVLYILF